MRREVIDDAGACVCERIGLYCTVLYCAGRQHTRPCTTCMHLVLQVGVESAPTRYHHSSVPPSWQLSARDTDTVHDIGWRRAPGRHTRDRQRQAGQADMCTAANRVPILPILRTTDCGLRGATMMSVLSVNEGRAPRRSSSSSS